MCSIKNLPLFSFSFHFFGRSLAVLSSLRLALPLLPSFRVFVRLGAKNVLHIHVRTLQDQLPPFHDCVTIPSTAMETPGIPTTHIIDTSLRTQAPEEVMSEIAKASVICIVYAVNEPKSFARLGDYWLPMIRKSLGAKDGSHGIPVLLYVVAVVLTAVLFICF